MAQFQVPQFIETEDKIVGPLTLQQFFYLAVPGFILFLLFFALQLWLWLIVASFFGAAAISLAFGKVNGRPMVIFLRSAFAYIWEPKIYTFKPTPKMTAAALPNIPKKGRLPATQGLTGLKGLIESLTTSKTAIPAREKPLTSSFGILHPKELKERYEVIRKATGEQEIARRIDYR